MTDGWTVVFAMVKMVPLPTCCGQVAHCAGSAGGAVRNTWIEKGEERINL
jgi:hypothetical protein